MFSSALMRKPKKLLQSHTMSKKQPRNTCLRANYLLPPPKLAFALLIRDCGFANNGIHVVFSHFLGAVVCNCSQMLLVFYFCLLSPVETEVMTGIKGFCVIAASNQRCCILITRVFDQVLVFSPHKCFSRVHFRDFKAPLSCRIVAKQ